MVMPCLREYGNLCKVVSLSCFRLVTQPCFLIPHFFYPRPVKYLAPPCMDPVQSGSSMQRLTTMAGPLIYCVHLSVEWLVRSYNFSASFASRPLCRLVPGTLFLLTTKNLVSLLTYLIQLNFGSVSLLLFRLSIRCIVYCGLQTQWWVVWTSYIIM